jgi:hypothetical protein
MAIVRKPLVAQDDAVVLDVPTDHSAIAGVQYGVGGLGTIALEGRILDGDWFGIGMKKPADDTALATLAAAGAGYADVSYCDAVRVRKTVAGAGPVNVGLSVVPRS